MINQQTIGMMENLAIAYRKQNSRGGQNLEKYKALNSNKCFNYKNLGYFERDCNQLNICFLPGDKPDNKKLQWENSSYLSQLQQLFNFAYNAITNDNNSDLEPFQLGMANMTRKSHQI